MRSGLFFIKEVVLNFLWGVLFSGDGFEVFREFVGFLLVDLEMGDVCRVFSVKFLLYRVFRWLFVAGIVY